MTKPAALSKCYADKIILRPMDYFNSLGLDLM